MKLIYWERVLGSCRVRSRSSVGCILVSCRYRLRPRVLRDVSHVDMRTELFGETVAMPILVAPTSTQRMAHPDGEIATAKGEDARVMV